MESMGYNLTKSSCSPHYTSVTYWLHWIVTLLFWKCDNNLSKGYSNSINHWL